MMGILGFKVALCLEYLRILSRGQRFYRRFIQILGVTCVVFHVAGTLVLIFNCIPVSKLVPFHMPSFVVTISI
jgi:hypothetical protein